MLKQGNNEYCSPYLVHHIWSSSIAGCFPRPPLTGWRLKLLSLIVVFLIDRLADGLRSTIRAPSKSRTSILKLRPLMTSVAPLASWLTVNSYYRTPANQGCIRCWCQASLIATRAPVLTTFRYFCVTFEGTAMLLFLHCLDYTCIRFSVIVICDLKPRLKIQATEVFLLSTTHIGSHSLQCSEQFPFFISR